MYKFVFRGDGILRAAALGEPMTSAVFTDALRFTPEPLLAEPDMSALVTFLNAAPTRRARRTQAQREEALRLADLIDASEADALTEKASDHLCAFVRAETVRPVGAPKQSLVGRSRTRDRISLAACLQRAVNDALCDPSAPSLLRSHGVDLTAWPDLPAGERVIRIVHSILREWGHNLPSLRTLRNNLSAYRRGSANYS